MNHIEGEKEALIAHGTYTSHTTSDKMATPTKQAHKCYIEFHERENATTL